MKIDLAKRSAANEVWADVLYADAKPLRDIIAKIEGKEKK